MDMVYIPSRGRAYTRKSHQHLQRYGMMNWAYLVEPFDYVDYVRGLREDGIEDAERHVLIFDTEVYKSPYREFTNPKGFQYEDERFWEEDLTTGPGPGRNAMLDIARERGESHCWMWDDDIQSFSINAFYWQPQTYTQGSKNREARERINVVEALELFERLLDKYSNLGAGEFDKSGLSRNHEKNRHIATGAKAYTCMRMNTAIDIPWRSRRNDDVVLTLDYLHRGLINLSSRIIVYNTPAPDNDNITGGMIHDNREKAQAVVNLYPFLSSISFKKVKRGAHHHVDYNKIHSELALKDGVSLDDLVLGS